MSLTKEERASIAQTENLSGMIRDTLSNMKESESKINLGKITEELTKRRADKIKK